MKTPKNANKVFNGILFDVYQWKQKMYDNSYKTFEMLKRKPSVDIIALKKDKIMILSQQQPTKPLFPSLPGGGLEKDEVWKSAAKRELLEESGYAASSLKLMDTFYGNSKLEFIEYLVVARDCKKISKQNLDSGEKIKVTFVNFDEFLQLCRNPKFTAPIGMKFMMYEALIDDNKKEELQKKIFNKC